MAQRVAICRASAAASAAASRARRVGNRRCRLPAVPIFREPASTIPPAPAVAGGGDHARCFANSTVPRREKGKGGGGASPAPSPAPVDDFDVSDEGDECPPWQNPLHHKDPKFDKVFFEDFEPGEEIPIVPLPPFDDGSGKVLATPQVREIAEEVLQLNMMEIMELSNRLGEHFGIEDDGTGVGAGADGGEGEAKVEEAEEERTAFDLKLSGFDAKSKIKVIKEVRAITGLGLKEAKEMVEGAPKVVKKDIKMEEAEELKEKLEAVGATVEIV